MKILKKLLVRIILLILTAGIVCGSVVAVLGYLRQHRTKTKQ